MRLLLSARLPRARRAAYNRLIHEYYFSSSRRPTSGHPGSAAPLRRCRSPLRPPQRRRLHVRRVTYEGFERADGLFDIEAHLVDTKDHDISCCPACAAPASRCTT